MSNTFGDNLKKYRLEKKIGINELGRRIGVSGAYISALEAGRKQNPSLDIIEKLSKELDIPSSLLTYDRKISEFYESIRTESSTKFNESNEFIKLITTQLLDETFLHLFFKFLGYEISLADDKDEYYVKINNTKYTYSQFMNLKNLIKSCIDNANELLK